ncbi:MAG: DHA2 family efflux MFS transporter permease subunit [Alphaproteobacteria bacterium]
MSAAATSAIGPEATTFFERAMVLATSTLTTMLVGMMLVVTSVIMPQLQGSLSATQDQVAWVITFNIIAIAVVTPLTGWFANRFGRRNVMVWSTLGFVVATILCGTADSLEVLVLYRMIQGVFGAPLNPLSNAIVLDTFPREQHGTVNSIYGVGVVVGPMMGPIIGGYLAEAYNWRWAFVAVGFVGTLAVAGAWLFIRDDRRAPPRRLDWAGFVALAIAILCFQLMLDRGERLDWFASYEVIIEAGLAVAAFYIFIVHSLTARRPFLNLRLLLDRNYAIGLLLVLIFGMMNFTPMALLPPLLQNLAGYPDDTIGFLLGYRGFGAFLGFFASIWVNKLDPRIGMCGGFLIQALSGWLMMAFDVNLTSFHVQLTSAMQGFAVGMIWVPLVVATFATLAREHLNEATAVFHLMRYIGSSAFISISVAVVLHTGQENYARMTEFVSVFNDALIDPSWAGPWGLDSLRGIATLSGEVGRQADMIGYINAFTAYTVLSLAVLPLVFFVRVPGRKQEEDRTA